MTQIKYAELIDRIKATITDSVVYVGLLFLITNIFESIGDVSTTTKIVAFFGVFIFYEPLFISLFGGTIGHYINGLRVKRDNNLKKNVILPLAILRYIVKIFLGVISLFTVSSNFENKAIHDMAVRSVVIKVK